MAKKRLLTDAEHRCLAEGRRAVKSIMESQSNAMQAANDRCSQASARLKMAMLEMVEARTELTRRIYLDEGATEAEATEWLMEIGFGREELLGEMNHESYDLSDSTWWALLEAWHAVCLLARLPVTPESLADAKRQRQYLEQLAEERRDWEQRTGWKDT
jgi:hypothetical protein